MNTDTSTKNKISALGGGKLTITVHSARNLYNTQLIGTQDPYCTLKLGKSSVRTKVHQNGGVTPSWQQPFEFKVVGPGETIALEVRNKNTISDDVIGATFLDVDDLINLHEPKWFRIGRNTRNSTDAGEVMLSTTFISDKPPPPPQPKVIPAFSMVSAAELHEAKLPDQKNDPIVQGIISRVLPKLSLKAGNGRFVTADPSGLIVANRDNCGDWEIWTTEYFPDSGRIAFKSFHGKYLVAQNDGKVVADRDTVGDWSKFLVVTMPGTNNIITLRSALGSYVTIDNNNRASSTKDQAGNSEKFTVIPAMGGSIPALSSTAVNAAPLVPPGFDPKNSTRVDLLQSSIHNISGNWRVFLKDANGKERSYDMNLHHNPDGSISGEGTAAHMSFKVKGTVSENKISYKEYWDLGGIESIEAELTENGTAFEMIHPESAIVTSGRKTSAISKRTHPKYFLPYYDVSGSWRVFVEQRGKKKSYSLELKQQEDGSLTGSGEAGHLKYVVKGKIDKNVLKYTEIWEPKGGEDHIFAELNFEGTYFKCRTDNAELQAARRVDSLKEHEKAQYFLPYN